MIEDGFIIKGETKEELDAKDTGFTYNAVQPKTEREDFTPTITTLQMKCTTVFLNNFQKWEFCP